MTQHWQQIDTDLLIIALLEQSRDHCDPFEPRSNFLRHLCGHRRPSGGFQKVQLMLLEVAPLPSLDQFVQSFDVVPSACVIMPILISGEIQRIDRCV